MKYLNHGESISFNIGEIGKGKLKLIKGFARPYKIGSPLIWKGNVFKIENISNDTICFSYVTIPKDEIHNEIRTFVIDVEYAVEVLVHHPWMSFPDLEPEKRTIRLATNPIQWKEFIRNNRANSIVSFEFKKVSEDLLFFGFKYWAEEFTDLPF